MAAFSSGPCTPWEPIWSCDLPTGADAVTGTAVEMATEILWKRTGQRFGLCELTLRPCRDDCFPGLINGIFPYGIYPWSQQYPYPGWYRGTWFNLGCSGGCTGGCSCVTISEVTLPAPVANISEVKVDGVVLNPDIDYRVDDWRRLVRLQDQDWPMCNNLNLDDTEPDTWSVTASYGEEVPVTGRQAVGELAAEFVNAMLCPDECALPLNMTSVTRANVTQTFADTATLLQHGLIGLYFSDMFIKTWNPAGIQSAASIYDIDGKQARIMGT